MADQNHNKIGKKMQREGIKLDKLDLELINLLNQNLTPKCSEIGKVLNASPTTIYRRIKNLQKKGVITGFFVKLNEELLGKKISALFFIKLKAKTQIDTVKNFEGVEEVYVPLDKWDAIAKVKATDLNELKSIKDKLLDFVENVEVLIITQIS